MTENANLVLAVRAAFQSSPLNKMITDDLDSLSGNPNGTTFARDLSGESVCLDRTGQMVDEGARLLAAVLGSYTPTNFLLEMDVSVNGREFCLTMTGPPTTKASAWTVARRGNTDSQAHRAISVQVELQ